MLPSRSVRRAPFPQTYVREQYTGLLQGPFNPAARRKAGLGDEYYMTLVTRGEVDLDERDVAEAHAKWVRGANSVDPDDDAVAELARLMATDANKDVRKTALQHIATPIILRTLSPP